MFEILGFFETFAKLYYKTNLNSCTHLLGNQVYRYKQGIHRFPDNAHLDHKVEYSQGLPLKSETKNDFKC